ncbi:hypothetical protein Esi_0179_0057 [Ectocarpus siliculosus]|uniref:Uncharacterized protein n=1 Tax=Ectocarpus siliculosus TaxID=2880 RepID=D7FNE5_ECTSI|nr:hypothetical protein Esi_0179_0057 [Ectocarpus siliculosus]|eukprot:CBJ30199.1 hypothetical protein Esi_0179_0057 [Ectocarpus siliculosus]
MVCRAGAMGTNRLYDPVEGLRRRERLHWRGQRCRRSLHP